MKMYLLPLIIMLLIVIATDSWLFYRWLKKTKNSGLRLLFFIPTLFFIGCFLYVRFGLQHVESYRFSAAILWVIYAFSLIYVPKTIYAILDSLSILLHTLFGLKAKALSRIGSVLAVSVAIMFLYGAFFERTNVRVKHIEVQVADLPPNFNNLTIAHFSDTHLGNWDRDTKTITKTIELINAQQPDIIVFSGDMVNNFADELLAYDTIFAPLQAQYGKFAVLGNHDYGDYTQWENETERNYNLERTKQGIRNLGFDLLLNEHRAITINEDSIYILGVENWGVPPFKQYGDLAKSMEQTNPSLKKVLISHDGSHWRAEVIGHESIVLTLSGHTHAAQVGIICKKIKWSPSKWIYNEWEGLYTEGNQYLYVNRGIGYVGIPMRIGVPPEITLITLKTQ